MIKIYIYFILFFLYCFHSLSAETFKQGWAHYKINEDGETVTLFCAPNDSIDTDSLENATLVIPGYVKYNGKAYTVVTISDGYFEGFPQIEHLVIGEGVEHICDYAFSSCYNLKSISIPSTVSYIGNFVFSECPKLNRITVSPNNKKFDSRGDCNAIINTNSKELVKGCVTTIMPYDIRRIGMAAYDGCTELRSIDIPEGVERIGECAFYNCISLRKVSLPKSLLYIWHDAFGRCEALEEIYIPRNVRNIDASVFNGCKALGKVVVDKDNPYYDSRDSCNAIIETATNTLVFGNATSHIVDGIRHIGRYAFAETQIVRIHIPASVVKVDPTAFNFCSHCISITVDKMNPVYNSANDCNAIVETATGTLVTGCVNTIIGKDVTGIGSDAFTGGRAKRILILPEGVRCIGKTAFAVCPELERVILPRSLEKIEFGAFEYCYTLREVICESAKCKVIPMHAFLSCASLRTFFFPNGLEKVENGAFSGCKWLWQVVVPATLQKNILSQK